MPSDLTTPTPSEPLELRGMIEGATPLPWSIDPGNGDIVSGPLNVCIPYAMSDRDKIIAVAAVNSLPALLDRLEALEKGLGQCRAQFQFYANEHRSAGKHDKAATNQYFADLALTTLAAPKETNNDR